MASLATVPTEDVLSGIAPDAEGAPTEDLELEGGELVEGGEPEGGEPTEGGEVEGQQQTRTAKGVDPEIGQFLEKTKAENPKLAAKIKGAIYGGIAARKELDKLTPHFPGGVADVLQLKAAFDEQLGGIENLEELGQDVALYKQLDTMLEAGDPRVIDNLQEMWPEAIAVLGPKIFDKLADVAPETYNKIYAGMVIGELRAQNLPQLIFSQEGDLRRALEMIQKPETAAYAASFIEHALQGVENQKTWMKTLGQTATAQVKDPVAGKAANGKADAERQQFENDKAQLFKDTVKAEYSPFLSSTIKTNIDKILAAKKRTLEPEQYRDFASLVVNKLNQAMNADKTHPDTVARFEKGRDKSGLLKYLKSRVTAIVNGANGQPGLVSKQYSIWFKGASMGAQKDKDGTGKPGIDPKTGKPAVQKPGTGWTKITKAEKTQLIGAHKIDWAKTTAEMRMKNRYALLDGRQVYHE